MTALVSPLTDIVPIEGFPGYFISRNGSVYSAMCGGLRELATRASTHTKGKTRYMQVKMVKDKRSSGAELHRLLAKAFIPNPEGKATVNHIDGNGLNNSLDNLEWATLSEQQRHRHEMHGTNISEELLNVIRSKTSWGWGEKTAVAKQHGVGQAWVSELIARHQSLSKEQCDTAETVAVAGKYSQ